MSNLTKKDQDLANLIFEYGTLRVLIAEVRDEIGHNQQAKIQFDKFQFQNDMILMKLERDFGIEVEGLAQAKQRQEEFDEEFFENLI